VKAKIHPRYQTCAVHCACGNTFVTRSTLPKINVDICSACHPFFTGKQKFRRYRGPGGAFQQEIWRDLQLPEDRGAGRRRRREEVISNIFRMSAGACCSDRSRACCAVLCGCASHPHPDLTAIRAGWTGANTQDLTTPYFDPDVVAVIDPPLGWKQDPPKTTSDHIHKVMAKSKSRHGVRRHPFQHAVSRGAGLGIGWISGSDEKEPRGTPIFSIARTTLNCRNSLRGRGRALHYSKPT